MQAIAGALRLMLIALLSHLGVWSVPPQWGTAADIATSSIQLFSYPLSICHIWAASGTLEVAEVAPLR